MTVIHWRHSHAIVVGGITGEVVAISTGESAPISGHTLHTVLTTIKASAGGTALWTSAILSSILSAVKASVWSTALWTAMSHSTTHGITVSQGIGNRAYGNFFCIFAYGKLIALSFIKIRGGEQYYAIAVLQIGNIEDFFSVTVANFNCASRILIIAEIIYHKGLGRAVSIKGLEHFVIAGYQDRTTGNGSRSVII